MALMFGRTSIGVVTPRPHFAGLDTDAGYFWLVLAFAIGACLLVMLIARSRLGRLLRGLADSPTALSTNGANINITLVVVFCVSAFIAAVAGALSGPVVGRTAGGNFASLTSLVLLAVLLIFGRGLVLPAFVAAAALVLPSYAQRVHFLGNWEPMAFGIGALLIGLSAASTGRPAFADALFEKADRRRRSPVAARGMADGDGRRPAGSEDHAVLVGETVA
jgi:ABC-type branched-subunit amino acid transport system permease subunit